MDNKNCETPCLCDTCLKARDAELQRVRASLLKEIEKLPSPYFIRYQGAESEGPHICKFDIIRVIKDRLKI